MVYEIWSNFLGLLDFAFIGLVDVVDRAFLLKVASSICSLEVLVRSCKCKQPIRIGTKMSVEFQVPSN